MKQLHTLIICVIHIYIGIYIFHVYVYPGGCFVIDIVSIFFNTRLQMEQYQVKETAKQRDMLVRLRFILTHTHKKFKCLWVSHSKQLTHISKRALFTNVNTYGKKDNYACIIIQKPRQSLIQYWRPL